MRGELCFSRSTRHGGGNDSRGVFVSDVVLYDEDGTDPALFAADDGG